MPHIFPGRKQLIAKSSIKTARAIDERNCTANFARPVEKGFENMARKNLDSQIIRLLSATAAIGYVLRARGYAPPHSPM
jgi:hypothetical protein